MEQYNASISMHCDSDLRQLVTGLIQSSKITHVIETGTFDGNGSTRMLAECFRAAGVTPRGFITMEVNWNSWRKAQANLSEYPFVKCLWGRSVGKHDALAFIQSDEVLKAHANHSGIFIDDPDDPVGFYSRETMGRLGGRRRDMPYHYIRDRIIHFQGERLLEKSLRRFRDAQPLLLLDSSGGIGYLEFTTVLRVSGGRPFFLLLDDVNHVKHFRSLQYMKNDTKFKILGKGNSGNWVAAGYMTSP